MERPLYPGPAGGQENDNRDSSSGEILLGFQPLISGHQYAEPLEFGRIQQLAVLQPRPAALERRGDFMLRQGIAQRDRRPLVEQDAHLGRSQRTACCVLQDSTRLPEGDAWKPLDELRDQGAVLEVLEQRRHGYAGTPEHPGSADAIRIALDRRTSRPVDHGENAITAACWTANASVIGAPAARQWVPLARRGLAASNPGVHRTPMSRRRGDEPAPPG